MRMVTAIVVMLGVIALFGGQLVAVGVSEQTMLGAYGITYTEAVLVAGAVSSAIAASITVVAFDGMKLGGMLPPWMEPIIASLAMSLAVMVTVSRATWKERTATPLLLPGRK